MCPTIHDAIFSLITHRRRWVVFVAGNATYKSCPTHFCPCPAHFCPCPTARDSGCRVYDLVYSSLQFSLIQPRILSFIELLISFSILLFMNSFNSPLITIEPQSHFIPQTLVYLFRLHICELRRINARGADGFGRFRRRIRLSPSHASISRYERLPRPRRPWTTGLLDDWLIDWMIG